MKFSVTVFPGAAYSKGYIHSLLADISLEKGDGYEKPLSVVPIFLFKNCTFCFVSILFLQLWDWELEGFREANAERLYLLSLILTTRRPCSVEVRVGEWDQGLNSSFTT